MNRFFLNWIRKLVGKSEPKSKLEIEDFPWHIQWKEHASKISKEAGYKNSYEAFKALDFGQLHGTFLERELRSVRWMLGHDTYEGEIE